MHDALTAVALRVVFDAEILRVLREGFNLRPALRLRDTLRAVCRRHVMIDDGERLFGMPTLRPVMRRPSKACGEVTSCTRCRSI